VEDGIVQAILMGIFFSGDGVLLLIRILKTAKKTCGNGQQTRQFLYVSTSVYV
jgi:hypothetical protein